MLNMEQAKPVFPGHGCSYLTPYNLCSFMLTIPASLCGFPVAAVVKNLLPFVLPQVRGPSKRHWNTTVGWLSFRAPPRGSQWEATPCSLQLLVAASLSWQLSSSLLLSFLTCSLPDRAVAPVASRFTSLIRVSALTHAWGLWLPLLYADMSLSLLSFQNFSFPSNLNVRFQRWNFPCFF